MSVGILQPPAVAKTVRTSEDSLRARKIPITHRVMPTAARKSALRLRGATPARGFTDASAVTRRAGKGQLRSRDKLKCHTLSANRLSRGCAIGRRDPEFARSDFAIWPRETQWAARGVHKWLL